MAQDANQWNPGMLLCERGSLLIFTPDRDEFLNPGDIIVHAWLIKEKTNAAGNSPWCWREGEGPISGIFHCLQGPHLSHKTEIWGREGRIAELSGLKNKFRLKCWIMVFMYSLLAGFRNAFCSVCSRQCQRLCSSEFLSLDTARI